MSTNQKTRKLGDLLRSIRSRLQLPIPALAEKLGIDRNTLGAYEREERLPDLEFLATFSKVTGWDVGKLVEARMSASVEAPTFLRSMGRIRDATHAAIRFALRRSSLTEADRADLQEAAFEQELDVDGLERLFGDRYPAGSVAMQSLARYGAAPGYAEIPLFDLRARAGGSGANNGEETPVSELAFREDWIRRELRVSPKDLRLIHVEGDSMEPDLRSGDIILVDHTDTAARREGVYVIRMDNALLVKALQRLPGGVISVTSRNPTYKPFSVNASNVESSEDFSIIGRVVWACRRF